jgi:transketolase N-terminal domain/subunit
MFIKDLQNILGEFTDGKKGNNIRDAKIYVHLHNNQIAEIKKIEVQHNNIIGSKMKWHPSENYTKIYESTLRKLAGQGLKILVGSVLLIYWATILLATFLQ